MKTFVNIFQEVKNVNGERFSKDSASVNAEDNSINNSLVHSFAFENKDEALRLADEVNASKWH